MKSCISCGGCSNPIPRAKAPNTGLDQKPAPSSRGWCPPGSPVQVRHLASWLRSAFLGFLLIYLSVRYRRSTKDLTVEGLDSRAGEVLCAVQGAGARDRKLRCTVPTAPEAPNAAPPISHEGSGLTSMDRRTLEPGAGRNHAERREHPRRGAIVPGW